MPPTVIHNNQWWLPDILFIFMLLMYMHDGMHQAIIAELVCSVLLFTFDGGSVGFFFNQPKYSSSSGHTVTPGITTTLATSEPRVNGASSSNNSSSSMLHQSRPPPCSSQSGWRVTGGNEMRTHQVPIQEPAQDLPMRLQLLGGSSIQSNRDCLVSPIHHQRQQLLCHNFPQPATPPPTPATA